MSDETTAVEGQAVAEGEGTRRRVKTYQPPDLRLRRYGVAITNAAGDPEILAALAVYNYDDKRMAEGKQLYDAVLSHIAGQAKEYGEQLEASAAMQKAWDVGGAPYGKSLRVARLALGEDADAQEALVLRGPRGESISRWIRDAATFYQNVLASPKFLNAMAGFGYTTEKLKEEQGLICALAEADSRHKKEKGEAQTATKTRDAKIAELDDWMSKFYEIARISIGDKQQWLEKLGMYQAS